MAAKYDPLHSEGIESEQIDLSDLQSLRDDHAQTYSTAPSILPHEHEKNGSATESRLNLVSNDALRAGGGGRHSTFSRLSFRTSFSVWWKAGLACIFVVAAAGATIGTLYPYEGQPLPQWPFAITVNALLSAYMVVLKAAATYLLADGIAQQKWKWFKEAANPLYDLALHDEATRGPLGAIRLLWRLSFHHVWHWLGCLLILLAVFIDPFTQQVLHYVDCNVVDPTGTASIPRSNIFIGNGTHVGAGLKGITAPEQAAIDAGVVAPGSQVSVGCSSGNCTFSSFGTIGYCSRCIDISEHVSFTMQNYTFNGEQYPSVNTSVENGTSVNFAFEGPQSNFSTMDIVGENDFQFLIGMPVNVLGQPLVPGPYDPASGGPPSGCNNAATNGTWRCRGYGAANCTLYPCIRTYNASVTRGALLETLITETETPEMEDLFGFPNGSTLLAAINATCLNSEQRAFASGLGYTVNTSTLWIPYNFTGVLDSAEPIPKEISNSTELARFQTEIQKAGCMYALDYTFPLSLTLEYLSNDFVGTLIGDWNDEGGGIAMFQGQQILQTLYNYGDFSFERTASIFRNVSDSLTTHMRSSPMSNLTADTYGFTNSAAGVVFEDKTCLQVEWRWLAVPAILVVFTMVFFAGVMLDSGSLSAEVQTWKSSPLPLLFYGVQPQPQQQSQEVSFSKQNDQHLADLERLAKRMHVRLVRAEDGNVLLQTSH